MGYENRAAVFTVDPTLDVLQTPTPLVTEPADTHLISHFCYSPEGNQATYSVNFQTRKSSYYVVYRSEPDGSNPVEILHGRTYARLTDRLPAPKPLAWR